MIIPARAPHSWGVGTGSVLRVAVAAGKVPPTVNPRLQPEFRDVFNDHARFVWRVLLGLGLADADVPDASQQVFVVVHDRLGDLADGCSLRTFIYGICLRVASDFRRRAHRRHERLVADLPERSTAATQEERAMARESLRAVEAALDRLPPAQREVFVLYEIEELTMDEVAQALGCPLQTAYSRLHAARKIVGALLGGTLDK
jgi:RNA polymerase sigma-70 factor, ECF subfamily